MAGSTSSMEADLPYGVRKLIAQARARADGGGAPTVTDWLVCLLERFGPMAEDLARGLDAAGALASLRKRSRAEGGDVLPVHDLLARAADHATARGVGRPAERDLATVILAASAYELKATGLAPPTGPKAAAPRRRTAARKGGAGAAEAAAAPARAKPAGAWRPRAVRPTPELDRLGRDVTKLAAEGKLSPVIGRDDEIGLAIETLCRRTKRNPLFVGPAGVGKTAIVEGLAQRIVAGEVPEALKGARVVALRPSVILAGIRLVTEFMEAMEKIIAEAKQEGIILFLDEVHAIVGAGGAPGATDMGGLLKPPLARGEIACIAATTDVEYRQYIEQDRALERRFQPLRVHEMTPAQTLEVLTSLGAELGALRGVEIDAGVLPWLVDFARQYLRNRYFPDKAIDLLEQCVAHAVAHEERKVTPAHAETVAQRLVGMPVNVDERLETLRQELKRRGLLGAEEIDPLVDRLSITLTGYDVRSERPNLVVLLAGPAAAEAERIAATIAGALFGSASRVVGIDFARFQQAHDVSGLLGAPPGYVGYDDTGPLHPLVQMPWCVLLARNVDACHPSARDILREGLARGVITDARSRNVFLSDAVVLITLARDLPSRTASLGFQAHEDDAEHPTTDLPVAESVGAALAAEIDLVCHGTSLGARDGQLWIKEVLLPGLAKRYRAQGIEIEWHESVVDWLLAQGETAQRERAFEKLVDDRIGRSIVEHVKANPNRGDTVLSIEIRGDAVSIQAVPKSTKG